MGSVNYDTAPKGQRSTFARAALWLVKNVVVGVGTGVALVSAFAAILAFGPEPLLALVAVIVIPGLFIATFPRQSWGVLLVGLVGAGVALWPAITSGTRDAERAEGEQMLGSAKGQVRAAYASTKDLGQIRTLTGEVGQGGCGLKPLELKGKYFHLRDEVVVTPEGATITCLPNVGQEQHGFCTLPFTWRGGEGTPQWTP